ncbi:excisionase family DNA binding protein [Paenibacillus cellulosilyticus]|uniref:Excisionase family DNA binding protein n=1 Tax=Paenibacillus cellulosilyticus TaxID=375489 RepID=A0A2V2YGR6_9BACL|nr:helix-turn-helix domain-containing protein [Paenibacillus cellulosilyticus]PWV92011.1 excisionase family DNA binding protein [Paenibacillus cellulosilyticus]QKS43383.1 helix-turn-helix domain-containing protein [Paenibacillus cellulosilyticus]
MSEKLAGLAASLEQTIKGLVGEGTQINEDQIRKIVREELTRYRLEGTLDANQAAVYLKVHRNTIYELSNKGELPYVKVGAQKRYRIAALEAYLEMNEVNKIAVG